MHGNPILNTEVYIADQNSIYFWTVLYENWVRMDMRKSHGGSSVSPLKWLKWQVELNLILHNFRWKPHPVLPWHILTPRLFESGWVSGLRTEGSAVVTWSLHEPAMSWGKTHSLQRFMKLSGSMLPGGNGNGGDFSGPLSFEQTQLPSCLLWVPWILQEKGPQRWWFPDNPKKRLHIDVSDIMIGCLSKLPHGPTWKPVSRSMFHGTHH